MDGFSDLNLFALVARHRNLAAAARELGVTPPSISKRLAQLEQRLGVRLVNRTTRRLSLTAEGEIYLANGSRILDDLAELEQLVTQQPRRADWSFARERVVRFRPRAHRAGDLAVHRAFSVNEDPVASD